MLPAGEQRLSSSRPRCPKQVGVAPVVRKLALELGDRLLLAPDVGLEHLQRGRPAGFGGAGFAFFAPWRRLAPRPRATSSRRRISSAQPPSYGRRPAVLDRERPVGDGVEQRAVVGDEQHGAGEGLERGLQRLAALEVEMVRRLVEDEEVRARRDDDRERQPAPLAAGEHRHRLLMLVPAGEEEAAEQVLRRRARKPGGALHAVEDRAALVQLELLLREVRGLDAVSEADLAAGRRPADRAWSRAASSCPSRSDRRARRARRAPARTRPRRGAPCRPP